MWQKRKLTCEFETSNQLLPTGTVFWVKEEEFKAEKLRFIRFKEDGPDLPFGKDTLLEALFLYQSVTFDDTQGLCS